MSNTSGTTTYLEARQRELTTRLTSIETELARISQAIVRLERRDIESAALARLQLDTERVSQAAAEAAASLARLTSDQLTAQAPFEMIPLSLLSLASEQLTLIDGVDTEAASMLNEVGIHHFADIAAFTPEDIAELGQRLGDRRRISKQGWVEQAALLAAGVETAFAARVRATERARPAEPPTKPATSAKIVDLATQRARRQGVALSRRTDLARVAGLAVCAVLLGGLAFAGSGVTENVMAMLGLDDACLITSFISGCSLVALP